MTNEEVMQLMTDMGLHEGGIENWIMDNAWVLVVNKAIDALKALDKQEPVGYVSEGEPDRLIAQKQVHTTVRNFRLFTHDVPLYTTPKREWVGLTAQEAADCWTTSASKTWHNFEAKLKDKNTRGQE